ncbi:hypothetical protein [Fodinicola feengrottensis]|uniref:Uncharacterized protein n=1 Tax=Fodinicola feengrottensis TaxID=435914 RepID=A0ABP4TTJ0_9ACTN|nr:hypothetical protein [Fodinicola feengrottensis]
MSKINIPVTPRAEALLGEVVVSMSNLFAISHEEAIGRVNVHWSGHAISTEDSEIMFLHETSDYWAKEIFYLPKLNGGYLARNPNPGRIIE